MDEATIHMENHPILKSFWHTDLEFTAAMQQRHHVK
jgi:hypothetical protein